MRLDPTTGSRRRSTFCGSSVRSVPRRRLPLPEGIGAAGPSPRGTRRRGRRAGCARRRSGPAGQLRPSGRAGIRRQHSRVVSRALAPRLGGWRGCCRRRSMPSSRRSNAGPDAAWTIRTIHSCFLSIPSSTSGETRDDAAMLDVGFSDVTLPGLVARTDRAFAWRAYVELLRAFCTRVHGLSEAAVDATVAQAGAAPAAQVRALKCMVAGAGRPWPEHARDQLAQAVSSLLKAAPTPTAVIVQARTFGAGTEPSGSGRVFSRDPVVGAIGSFGEFRPGADRLTSPNSGRASLGIDRLRRHSPAAAAALCSGLASIEVIHHDMCEVEFTLEAGELFLARRMPWPLDQPVRKADRRRPGRCRTDRRRHRARSDPPAALEDLQPSVVSRRQQLPVLAQGNVPAPGVAIARLLGWVADGSRLPCRRALRRPRSSSTFPETSTAPPQYWTSRCRRVLIAALVCVTGSDSRRPTATPRPWAGVARATSPGVGGRASRLAAHSGEARRRRWGRRQATLDFE